MYLQRILLQIRLACQGEKRRDRFVNEAIKGALLHLLSAYFFFLCAINFFFLPGGTARQRMILKKAVILNMEAGIVFRRCDLSCTVRSVEGELACTLL